jgi:DNA adenine methylase
MKPLYIWAGGKSKMIPKYIENPSIPKQGFDTYVEPFFGGGAMMCWVMKNCPDVKRFVLNDIKSEITGIYTAIKFDLSIFISRLDTLEKKYIPLCKDDRKKLYYDIRNEYTQNWKQWNSTEESATLYFLMKTAFNGIWQETKTSNGRFSTPSGLLNHKTNVYNIENVLEWNKFLQNVDIYNDTWDKACKNISDRAFYFMDPPYRESFTSYGEGFTDTDQENLINFCKLKDLEGDYVFYCNRDDSNDGFFDTHKGHLLSMHYDIKYTAGRRKKTETGHEAQKAKEILLYSPKIISHYDRLIESAVD